MRLAWRFGLERWWWDQWAPSSHVHRTLKLVPFTYVPLTYAILCPQCQAVIDVHIEGKP